MGVWGTGIFDDDLAADVKDHFTTLISEGLDPVKATRQLKTDMAEVFGDGEETLVLWLSLAATQWKLGCLLDPVRNKAIRIIDSGKELKRWVDTGPGDVKRREKHLAKLKEKLLSPQPKPRKIRTRVRSSTSFQAGDIVRFQWLENKNIRFCVTELWGDLGGDYCTISILGFDDGKPFRKSSLKVKDLLGPCFALLNHEPEDRITILKRSVGLPDRKELARALNAMGRGIPVGRWKEFEERIPALFTKVGWSM